jgi:hypothetical protein
MFRHKALVFIALLNSAVFLPGQNEINHPEVAPGVVLPSTGTIYGLDVFEAKPSLLQIHPTEIHANSHAGSNFARSAVYAGPHSTVELTGTSSAATFHVPLPVFYVKLNGDDPELLRSRVHLIRLKTVKDRRVVSEFSMNIFGGQKKRQYDDVAVSKSDVADTPWLKLTPQSTLEPGEYGIVFMPKDPNLFPDVVYDFSVPGVSTQGTH